MAKKTYDNSMVDSFPKNFKMELPDGYRIDIDYDEEGEQIANLRGGFSINDEGEETSEFSAAFITMNSTIENREEMIKEGKLKDHFVPGMMMEQVAEGVMTQLQEQFGPGTRLNMYGSYPASVIMKFYKPFMIFGVTLESYVVMCLVEVTENLFFGFNTVYQNNDEGNGTFFKHLLNVIKAVRVSGKPIDTGKLTPKKLEEALSIEPGDDVEALDLGLSIGINFQNGDEEISYTLNNDGSITGPDGDEVPPYEEEEEENPFFGLFSSFNEMNGPKISEEDSRKVIVDNKWSFRLPDGLDLLFDESHVDIMGSDTTANYVVKGLQYDGRYFFDFELRERFEDGISTDVDVLGCRYDNDAISGNAQQKKIKDDDDLYVDLINKPIFFFNSMVSIRVRGEDIRPWDFTAGLKSSDEDMTSKWDEVKVLINELAESIQLLDSTKKATKKKSKKTDDTSDPDFIIQNGVLRKYIGDKRNIVIPDGVKELADSVFSGFSKIKSVVVPEGVKKIGRRCFENCTHLKNCYLPDSLEQIGGYAFVDCHELKEVYLSDKIKSLGDSTFSECFALRDVRLPKKINEIDSFAFKNCDAFSHIVIPEGVKSIGASSFTSCDNLEYLFIPASVTEITTDFMNNHPFAGNEKMTIHTPEGSFAQKFAEENGIPYQNASKGKVTADNAGASTKSAGTQSGSAASGTNNSGLTFATPDESLYSHYDSKSVSASTNFLGMKIERRSSGTDYQFYQLADDLGDDASEELKSAVSQLSDTGATSYKLADRAAAMRKVFHVSPEIYNVRDDRESELREGLMQKAYMMSAIRSFAWTVSKYCEDKGRKPASLSLDELQNIIAFIAEREWLNYEGNSYCKSLCGTSDIHVYYIPDNTSKSVKSILSPSGSLDGLRKDLEYIYPAIEKIYEDIKENRDYNEPLESNESDVLYAWCALAYAARAPFFSEDGPMFYFYSQEETEEERQQKEEERRRQAIEERAQISKEFLKTYGKNIEKNPRIEFRDKKFVFTGLSARRYAIGDDTDYAKMIEDRGGLTRSKVSGVTDYLVVDPAGAGGSKINDAIENQKKGKPVKIIHMDDFRKALGLPADEVAIASKTSAPKSTSPAKAANATPAQAPKATAAPKQPTPSKPRAERPAAGEKTVTVDNTWVVTVPAGFKYSTDKKIIGDHRNIIIMEDKASNKFEWPFEASISFTSMFSDSQDNSATWMAQIMAGIIGDEKRVIRDEEDIYVAYGYQPNRSYKEAGEKLDVFQMILGCGKGVSSIQVFFSNSKLSLREQTNLVDKVAKSIRLVSETPRYTTTASSSTGLTTEQQRQMEELNRQMDDLKEQAAYYSAHAHELSEEDRATLAKTKGEMEKLSSQLDGVSTDQAKFGDYLRQKEEQERKKEEERQRKIAEAKAAGKSEDDMINMYVILCNERKLNLQWEKTQKEFYDAYKDYFPAYKTRDLGNLRKEVKEKIKDKETRRYYAESFMRRPVKDRYDVATDSYFSLDRYADYSLRSEDAIIRTTEWYTPEEMPEVRKLMDEQHDRDNKGANDAFDPVEKKWKNYWSAKEFLKIVVRDGDSGEMRDDCRLFQTKVANNILTGPVIVEVLLATKGMFQMSTPAMNFFPFYWSTTAKDIWETARRNEIKDNSTVYIDDINDIVRNAIKTIGEKYKESYPDYKPTLNGWNTAISRNANAFADYISSLYNNTDRHFTAVEIKDKLKASFATEYDLAEAKEKLFQRAKRDGLALLAEILSERSAIKDMYDSIPKLLSENIKEVRKEKIQEANEKSYDQAKLLCDSNNIKDLERAADALTSLGNFKDAKSLLKQCSLKIEDVKSTQYDEVKALFAEGTEESIVRAIDKLNGLGQYKDAPDLSKEYQDYLKKERVYQDALKEIESDGLSELRAAKAKLEGLNGFKNADKLLITCRDKIDVAQEKLYLKAIDLASEGTEDSLKEAVSLMNTIIPYKDSDSKMKELREILNNERTYSNAVGLTNSREISDLIVAKGLFENLGGYKDSVIKATACDKFIDELCENKYQEARKAESVYTLTSQKEAIAKYNQLGDYKDSFERKKICSTNCTIIQEIQGLEAEIESLKKELAAITGAFKKKERQAKEAQINQRENRLYEIKGKLADNSFEGEGVVLTDVLASESTASTHSISNTAASAPISAQGFESKRQKKKSKSGLIIAILLVLLIAAIVYLMQSGLIGNKSKEGTSIDTNEQSYETDSSTNNNANSVQLTVIENGEYIVTCGDLKDALFTRMRGINPSFRDLTTEFETAGYYAIGSDINRDGDAISESFMIKVLPGGGNNKSSDVIKCFCFVASDDIDYSSYFAEGINLADPGVDKAYAEKVLSEKYKVGKETQSTGEDGNLNFSILTFNNLTVYYTVVRNLVWCAITDPSMDFKEQFNEYVNVW